MKKKILKEREGFALIITLLGLALMSILGIAIIGITTSNARMTKIDSQSQGTYYIAEAGVSQAVYEISEQVEDFSDQTLSHDEFFEKLAQHIDGHLKNTSVSFEPNIGKSSSAIIDVEDGTLVKEGIQGNYSERIVNYVINSKGIIGDLNRAVATSVNISHKIKIGSAHHPAFDYAIYSGGDSIFSDPGGATIRGSIYGHDLKFDSTKTNIEGMIISEKSVDLISAVNLKGNIYAMDGKVNLLGSSIKMKGDIHAREKVTLSSGTTVEGSIYTDNNIVLDESSAKVTGAMHSGGKVRLGHGANVKNIYTNKSVEFEGTHVVTGDIYSLLGVTLMYGADVKNIYTAGNLEFKETDATHVNVVSVTKDIDPEALGPVIKPNLKAYEKINGEIPLTIFNIEEGYEDIVGPDWPPSQHTIEYGSYKNLTLKWNDTAKFSSGNYYFNEINASAGGIKLELDLSSGPINIYVKDNIKFGHALQISISEDGTNYRTIEDLFKNDLEKAIELAGKIYWETHSNFQLPQSCYFLGTVLADNNFVTGHAPKLIGAYAVNKGEIKIDGYGSTIIYAPPTDSTTGGSGGNGAVNKGRNTTPEEEWIITKDPVREQ